MKLALSAAGFIAFSTSMFTRMIDPVVPQISADFGVALGTVALLATAFALPFAIIQPLLGPVGDFFGKTKLMLAALVVLVAVSVIGAFATSFTWLVITRVIAGAAAGGIFPAALAFVSDNIDVERRQIALGRFLTAALSGNLIGAWVGGLIGDLVGWRGVLLAASVCGMIAIAAGILGFRKIKHDLGPRFDLDFAANTYRTIFANPRAKVCYFGVLIEGIVIFGLFPFVAILLHQSGEYRATIAGFVIAGFAVGGAVYGLFVSSLLRVFGTRGLMIWGGLLAAIMLLAAIVRLPWQMEFVTFFFMGLGFYMLHNCFQLAASEISPTARGSALALHSSFFFLGHAIGPVFYWWGFANLGIAVTLSLSALVIALTGAVSAQLLFKKEPGGL